MKTGNPDIDLIPEWFWVLTVTLFGLAIGSFLNVVIYRVPKMYPDLPDEETDSSEEGNEKKVALENTTNKEENSSNKEKIVEEKIVEEQNNAEGKQTEEKTEEKVKDRNPNLPEEEKISLLYPKRSFCPNCGHNITALENIPVLSYIFLGGKCRGCREKISLIYPFVEALTAILFVLAFYHQMTKPIFSIADYVANVVFISSIIALIFIDYNEMILPNVITLYGAGISFIVRIFVPNESPPTNTFLAAVLSGIILIVLFLLIAMIIFDTRVVQLGLLAGVVLIFSIALNWLIQDPDKIFVIQEGFFYFWQEKIFPYPALNSLINGTLGAIIGAGSLMVIAGLYFVLRGIEGMGGGDFKMMLYVGMFLGWQLTFSTLLLAPALAMIPVIVILILKGGEAWQAKLPFGVFLGAGAIISLLYGKQIIEGYILFTQKYLMSY
ncbi:MAG: prepilin peptidase [Acidobacteria bacterium]|nr:prepilin peptidase [Acidobacteriota bacterium]